MNKRRYSRVKLKQRATLLLNKQLYSDVAIDNLSVSGMFIPGQFPCKRCDNCEILLEFSTRKNKLEAHIPGVVVRIEKRGVAIEFIHRDETFFSFLETIILYASKDPLSHANEFPDNASLTATNCCI